MMTNNVGGNNPLARQDPSPCTCTSHHTAFSDYTSTSQPIRADIHLRQGLLDQSGARGEPVREEGKGARGKETL